MAFLMLELLRARGVDARDAVARATTFGSLEAPNPFISWADYVTLMDWVGSAFGSGQAVIDATKALQKAAYSEIRALAGFFPSLMPFYTFVNTSLMAQLSPAVSFQNEVASERRVRTTFTLKPTARACQTFWDGTIALVELFPWHADIDEEAQVTVLRRTRSELVLDVELPAQERAENLWGTHRHRVTAKPDDAQLTPREQEVLDLVAKGYTNAQIAKDLGTATATVKNQISSILGKMDAANRTELAIRSRR